MHHYIMIRSAYSDPFISQGRLKYTEAVTARSLRAQTCHDFELIVRLDEQDPYRIERSRLFRRAGVPVHFIFGPPVDPTFQDSSNLVGPWRSVMEPGDTLQTRLDDDDALADDAVERLHEAIVPANVPVVYTFPEGVDLIDGNLYKRGFEPNQFLSLWTPRGSTATVYDTTHIGTFRGNRVRVLSPRSPGWLWVRHEMAVSIVNGRRHTPKGRERSNAKALFSIDWAAVGA